MRYSDHVWKGVILVLEAFALVMVTLCTGLIYVFGLPFYLVSKVSDRYFNRVNEEQINDNLL